MIQLFQLILSGFWQFIGGLILICILINAVLFVWNRFWRHWNIRKWGYPPESCDADGDFKPEKD